MWGPQPPPAPVPRLNTTRCGVWMQRCMSCLKQARLSESVAAWWDGTLKTVVRLRLCSPCSTSLRVMIIDLGEVQVSKYVQGSLDTILAGLT